MNIVKLHSANIELRIGDIIQYSTPTLTDKPESIVDIVHGDRGIVVYTVDSDDCKTKYTLSQLESDFFRGFMTKITDDTP